MQNDTFDIWALYLKPSIFCVIYFCSIICHPPSQQLLSLNKNLANKSVAAWVMLSPCTCICAVQKQSYSSSCQFIQSIRPLFNTHWVGWPSWRRWQGVNGRQLRHLTSYFPEFSASVLIPSCPKLSWCSRTICSSLCTHSFSIWLLEGLIFDWYSILCLLLWKLEFTHEDWGRVRGWRGNTVVVITLC